MEFNRYNKNKGIFKSNFKQMFTSGNFYVAILLNIVIMIISLYSGNNRGIKAISRYGVCFEFFDVIYFGILPKLIILVSALPVVNTFCTDWNTGYIRYITGRTGEGRYLYHKVCICIIGSFMTAFLSLSIFTVILRTQMPMITAYGLSSIECVYPFGVILGQHPYIYQLFRIICFSSFCAIWSTVGLAVSAYIPNRYVVYSSSFVCYYIIEQIINNKIAGKVPTCLAIPYLGVTATTTPLFNNVIVDFIYINVLFVALSFIVGGFFIYGARRRLKNEFI